MWNYRSFAVSAEGNVEAELPIFGNESRVLVEKLIFRPLAVKTERKLWKSRQRWNAEAELHIFGRPGRTSAESGTSDLYQSRQSGSAGAELHIFGSKGRAEVRKRNFTFLAVNAERKCGRGTSDLWQSRQSGNAEAEHQVFSSQGRAEVWKRNFRSLAVKRQSGKAVKHFDSPVKLDVRKQILTALSGPYPTDCHCQCWRKTLLTAILKDNVKTMCG